MIRALVLSTALSIGAPLAVVAQSCAPPPPPAGAPTVVAQVKCREVRHQPPPPFGDGSAYNVFLWQWIPSADGTFTTHDDFSGYEANVIAAANTAHWQKALGGWKVYWWATPDGSSRGLVLTVPAPDPNTVPVCTAPLPV